MFFSGTKENNLIIYCIYLSVLPISHFKMMNSKNRAGGSLLTDRLTPLDIYSAIIAADQ